MKALKPEYIREDDRGKLIQLITGKWEQLTLLYIKKNKSMGGHYHTKGREYFYVNKGFIVLDTKLRGKKRSVHRELKKDNGVLIEAFEWHWLWAKEDSVVIKLATHQYDKDNPDTWQGDPNEFKGK